jgi:hypothetical protein
VTVTLGGSRVADDRRERPKMEKSKEINVPESPAKHKRLTLSEIVEMSLSKGPSKTSAVSLSRNAAGETLIEVVVAAREGDDAETIEDAERRAREVYDRLAGAYPRCGHDGSSVTLSRNAKGETQIEVATRTSDQDGTRTLTEIAETAEATYTTIRCRYPMANGLTAKPGSVA